MMNAHSPVLHALADLYEESQAGRTGEWKNDFQPTLKQLLRKAGCEEGDRQQLAERDLRRAAADGLLTLVPIHPRDRESIAKVRFSPAKEAELFALLSRNSPAQKRSALAEQFANAAGDPAVPSSWQAQWRSFCANFSAAALAGESLHPFDRNHPTETAEILSLLPKLLAWPDKTEGSLVRFASALLCNDSKRLQTLAAQETKGEFEGKLRGRLGQLLELITGGELRTLDDLGILANPRFALLHGPLRVRFSAPEDAAGNGSAWIDFGRLHGPFRISLVDIERIEEIATTAQRCLTVENETTFHELAKLHSGELLIQTSYPGSATVKLLRKLRDRVEFYHFGDSDEDGFAILESLRTKTGLDFQPLHMERGRMPFEQEALGAPKREWPFY